jgi:soluble lytic murein transglycosylase-like protein
MTVRMTRHDTIRRIPRSAGAVAAAALVLALPQPARAGAQLEMQLAPSVVTVLSQAISDRPVPADYVDRRELRGWLDQMSPRLAAKIPDARSREELLASVHYEAIRAGLDPQLVLGVIQVESAFRKYAVSSAGARGYMQVMPFWTRLIGSPQHNLFHLRTNLRYGCVILRLYLDIENGDVYRALGRYNGSLGQPQYPTAVLAATNRNWSVARYPVVTTLGAVGYPALAR